MVKLNSNLGIELDISKDSLNSGLLNDLKVAAENAGKVSPEFFALITTAKSDHNIKTKSGVPSRHHNGNAVDIAMINNVSYKSDSAKFKQLGDLLVNELTKLGYVHTPNESGNNKVVIWQSADHFNHIHVSNKEGEQSIASSLATQDSPDNNSLSFEVDPYITAKFAKKESVAKKKILSESDFFGKREKIKSNHVIIPANDNNMLNFNFNRGKVLSVDNVNSKYNISIVIELAAEKFIINYYGLKDTYLKRGGVVRDLDPIGRLDGDVKIEVLDRFSKPFEVKKLISAIKDSKTKKPTNPNQNKKNKDKKNKEKDKEKDKYKPYPNLKTWGRPTDKQDVTQGWIWKQMINYFTDKAKR